MVVSVVLVACGGHWERHSVAETPEDEISAASGTRLRMPRYRHDEAVLHDTIYDTELGVHCTFRVAGDGVERCLPLQVEDVKIHYADSARRDEARVRRTT